jgi:hypothetical protein
MRDHLTLRPDPEHEKYRNIDYVRRETNTLAEQLANQTKVDS